MGVWQPSPMCVCLLLSTSYMALIDDEASRKDPAVGIREMEKS
ncbi:hypothetical protein CGRA01v4_03626 [Colletotrichum graminicola]|nr:hypothetical protein CGRA01v4_03626 [Colletotrichum graminicola]